MKFTEEWGCTINLCVLVALCEETEGLSFPTRSGYGLLKPQEDSPGNIFIILLPKREISKNSLRRYLLKSKISKEDEMNKRLNNIKSLIKGDPLSFSLSFDRRVIFLTMREPINEPRNAVKLELKLC